VQYTCAKGLDAVIPIWSKIVSSRVIPKYLLLLAIAWIGAPVTAHAQQLTAADRAEWSQKLVNLIPVTLEGSRTVQDLAQLKPDDIYRILADSWSSLANSDVKQYILSCIVQNDNDRILDILQLGVSDESLAVQNRALQYCESFGFDSFTEDFTAYQAWRQRTQGKPLKEVIAASMKTLVAALPAIDEAHRSAIFNILVRTNLSGTSHTSKIRREAALAAGLPDALAPWIRQQNNLMWTAYQLVRNLRPDEAFLRRVVLPLTDPKIESAVRYQALSALGSDQNLWASAPLMKMLIAEYPEAGTEIIGQAVSQIGDPHCIPALIAMMESDNTPEGNRVIGNILTPLTGVSNAYVRDAAWWRAWWNRNNARFAADVRTMPIPKLAVHARPMQAVGQNQEPARPVMRQIADDPKRAYWFIDPVGRTRRITNVTIRRFSGSILASAAARGIKSDDVEQPPTPPIGRPMPQSQPAGGVHLEAPGLIVVLTSDGDAASAAGFWQEAAYRGLDKQYCVAVVVAPKWSENQQLVWLTAQDLKGVKEAKFSIEKLAADVVKDVSSVRTIDASRIFIHGIGNGGSAAYAASLDEKSPFRGTYVLGGAFKSAGLPPLERAGGRRYLIQNSKDDHVHPYWTAEAAQKMLVQKGAVVKLEASTGYLGSQGADAVMAQLKSSFDWLAASK
jgi:predicted esterase